MQLPKHIKTLRDAQIYVSKRMKSKNIPNRVRVTRAARLPRMRDQGLSEREKTKIQLEALYRKKLEEEEKKIKSEHNATMEKLLSAKRAAEYELEAKEREPYIKHGRCN